MHYVDEKTTNLAACYDALCIYLKTDCLNSECGAIHCAKWRILETVALT